MKDHPQHVWRNVNISGANVGVALDEPISVDIDGFHATNVGVAFQHRNFVDWPKLVARIDSTEIDHEQKAELIALLNEMRTRRSDEGQTSLYERFVNLAAGHATVLEPVISVVRSFMTPS